LGDPWAKHLEGSYKAFIFYPTSIPLGLQPLLPIEYRDNPFSGQYTLKSKEIRKWRGIMMESGKYGRERYNGSLREFLVANPSPRKTTY
jgi:hypothetical protein